MPHAQTVAGGVGEEIQAVEGLLVAWVGRAVKVGLCPAFLPLGFYNLRIVWFYLVSPIFSITSLFCFSPSCARWRIFYLVAVLADGLAQLVGGSPVAGGAGGLAALDQGGDLGG